MVSFCKWLQQDWVKPYVGIFTVLHFAYMACGLMFFIKGIFLWYYLNADYGSYYLQEVQLHSSNTSLYSTLAVLAQVYLALSSIYVIGSTLICIMVKRITIFLEGNLKEEMKRVMVSSYHGDNGTDRLTMSINTLYMRLNCCAIDDYRDLHKSPWQRQYEINTTRVEFKAPYFCCSINCTSSHTYCNNNMNKRSPKIDQFTSIDQVECTIRPNQTNSNYMKGCYNVLKGDLNHLNICNIVFIVIEILTVILGIHFYRQANQHDIDVNAGITTAHDTARHDLLPDNKLGGDHDNNMELKT